MSALRLSKREWEGFLCADVPTTLRQFARLPGAQRGGSGQGEYVYIPGQRDPASRVLIVAHADTVWDRRPTLRPRDLAWKGRLVTSYGARGCGADDRAGIAAAWLLRASGHSVLVTTGEEIGGLGASAASKALRDELPRHAWALQVDRAGDMEGVFYDGTRSDAFEDWLFDALPAGWRLGDGTFTDIAILCPEARLCGVNLAAGYLYEHTYNEVLCLDAWERTMDAASALLALDAYPRWTPDAIVPWRGTLLSRMADAEWMKLWQGEDDAASAKGAEGAPFDDAPSVPVDVWMARHARTNAAGDVIAYDADRDITDPWWEG